MVERWEPGQAVRAGAGPGTAGDWASRSDLQLLADQLHALEAWHRARRHGAQTAQLRGVSREMRLDLSRRQEARRREQEALLGRAAQQLALGSERLASSRRPRAVLVHRREWVRNRVAEELEVSGVRVVALLDNGADAVGVTVVEQPDLLLVEDALPMRSGPEVIRETCAFSSRTRIAAHVDGDRAAASVRDAGAEAVFPRRAAPAEIARGLLAMVGQGSRPA